MRFIPSERPVRNASSSSAAGRLPRPIFAEPWPIAGTMVPSRNLTVRAVPVEATAAAPSRANAPDKVTNELSATQRSLNSRRLSDRVPLLLFCSFDCVLDLKIVQLSSTRLAHRED